MHMGTGLEWFLWYICVPTMFKLLEFCNVRQLCTCDHFVAVFHVGMWSLGCLRGSGCRLLEIYITDKIPSEQH